MMTTKEYDRAASLLAERRNALKMPLEQLAAKVGESSGKVLAALIGGVHRDDEILAKIADALDVLGPQEILRLDKWKNQRTPVYDTAVRREKHNTAPPKNLSLTQKKQWGAALRVILAARDISSDRLDAEASINKRVLDNACAGGSLQGLVAISNYLNLSHKQAVAEAEATLTRCIHREHFGDILLAYRTRREPALSQLELGKTMFPDYAGRSALQNVSNLERGQVKPGHRMTLRLLEKLGFKSMHEFILAAGLGDKYPNTPARLVASALGKHIEALQEEDAAEPESTFTLSELARRRHAKNDPQAR